MKFTKLTSSVLAGATLLSILAPTASFAATSAQGSQDATQDNGIGVNAGILDTGKTVTGHSQEDNTKVGISFGDNKENTNDGYLRLQKVPATLDFGNHQTLLAANPTFSADGKNVGTTTNDLHASYDNTDSNRTVPLNTKNDAKLAAVKGDAWVTVVDKQTTRTIDTPSQYHAGTDDKAGSWVLSVKADNELAAVDTAGKRTSDTINNATLSFNNTAYGRTQNVYGLTTEAEDAGYHAGSEAGTDVASITQNIGVTLASKGSATDTTVATAAADEGQGANVFGWAPADIQLTMPTGAAVNNAIYQADLTWTLSSTVA